jgi:hypothetical protein
MPFRQGWAAADVPDILIPKDYHAVGEKCTTAPEQRHHWVRLYSIVRLKVTPCNSFPAVLAKPTLIV